MRYAPDACRPTRVKQRRDACLPVLWDAHIYAAKEAHWRMSLLMSSVETTDYRPSEDEQFMNPRQREYFRNKLLGWKDEILRESRLTLENL